MLDKKTVLLLGSMGYIGNALTQRLLFDGYRVIGIDNKSREYSVIEQNSYSAIEQYPMDEKVNLFKSMGDFKFYNANINKNTSLIKEILETEKPGTVCNLAHQPSGPYSMIDCNHANSTLENNILGTNNIL
jgi:UDP-sulfoquinovose synthase